MYAACFIHKSEMYSKSVQPKKNGFTVNVSKKLSNLKYYYRLLLLVELIGNDNFIAISLY